mmetsp:Transcript_24000/g.24244  ORF Transcript_24000/g.24244 Transcript_24000/m.24244 type:complete len:779 (-) Transcript_24000:512-2848(-)
METRKVSHSDIGSKYRILGDLGVGTFGSVALAVDTESNCDIAIKHIPNINIQHELTKRTIRELTLLNSLRHINIISILDAKIIDNSLYMMTELCEYDLHTITHAIGNPSRKGYQIVTQASHYILILGQILKALSFVHANNVIHRDIKPGNILVNSNLLVKLCDFGFARSVDNCGAVLEKDTEPVTEYMVTRWYRAPELLLNPGLYGKAQDVWSVACTFCEIFRRYPLFPGKNTVDQVKLIVETTNRLTRDDVDYEMSDRSKRFALSLESPGNGLEAAISEAWDIHPDMIRLLKHLLTFNPKYRVTAGDAVEYAMFRRHRMSNEIDEVEPIVWKNYQDYLSLISEKSSPEHLLEVVEQEVGDIALDLQREDMGKAIMSSLMADADDDEVYVSDRRIKTGSSNLSSFNSNVSRTDSGHSLVSRQTSNQKRRVLKSPASVCSESSNISFADALPAGLNTMWSLTSKITGKVGVSPAGSPTGSVASGTSGISNLGAKKFNLSRFVRSSSTPVDVEDLSQCNSQCHSQGDSDTSDPDPLPVKPKPDKEHMRSSHSSLSNMITAAKSVFRWHAWETKKHANSVSADSVSPAPQERLKSTIDISYTSRSSAGVKPSLPSKSPVNVRHSYVNEVRVKPCSDHDLRKPCLSPTSDISYCRSDDSFISGNNSLSASQVSSNNSSTSDMKSDHHHYMDTSHGRESRTNSITSVADVYDTSSAVKYALDNNIDKNNKHEIANDPEACKLVRVRSNNPSMVPIKTTPQGSSTMAMIPVRSIHVNRRNPFRS